MHGSKLLDWAWHDIFLSETELKKNASDEASINGNWASDESMMETAQPIK